MQRVLLFGLSGDPPTGLGGHLGLVSWAARRGFHLELGGEIDGIWVLPVRRHAYAEKSRLAPFADRVRMCRLCFEGRGLPIPVEVSEAEDDLARFHRAARGPAGADASPLGTIDLIDFLQFQHPPVRFGLLLGADTARDLFEGRWKRAEELLHRVSVVVAPRAGFDAAPEAAPDAPVLEQVSSTAARAAARAGDSEALRRMVVDEVADYIEARGLYRDRPAPEEAEPSR